MESSINYHMLSHFSTLTYIKEEDKLDIFYPHIAVILKILFQRAY